MEDYIKCELIDGGSPRYLDTISNLLIVAIHHTHINTCYVLLLLLTVSMCTTLSKIWEHQGLGNIALQEMF